MSAPVKRSRSGRSPLPYHTTRWNRRLPTSGHPCPGSTFRKSARCSSSNTSTGTIRTCQVHPISAVQARGRRAHVHSLQRRGGSGRGQGTRSSCGSRRTWWRLSSLFQCLAEAWHFGPIRCGPFRIPGRQALSCPTLRRPKQPRSTPRRTRTHCCTERRFQQRVRSQAADDREELSREHGPCSLALSPASHRSEGRCPCSGRRKNLRSASFRHPTCSGSVQTLKRRTPP